MNVTQSWITWCCNIWPSNPCIYWSVIFGVQSVLVIREIISHSKLRVKPWASGVKCQNVIRDNFCEIFSPFLSEKYIIYLCYKLKRCYMHIEHLTFIPPWRILVCYIWPSIHLEKQLSNIWPSIYLEKYWPVTFDLHSTMKNIGV